LKWLPYAITSTISTNATIAVVAQCIIALSLTMSEMAEVVDDEAVEAVVDDEAFADNAV